MVDGIKVEIMGNVQKRIEGGAWEPPVDVKHHRRFVDVQGMQVPVLSLEYEHHACMVLGRMDRAETLRKRLAEKYERLTTHGVTLRGDLIVLRPMTEGDWDVLLRWNRDPEVLYFADGADVKEYDLADVRKLYRGVSWNAFCFIIEIGGAPIGECWLQKMNLDRILKDHPGKDCRRIDLMIGEKGLWGRGIGTEVIRLLSRFGFERQQADLIFGCDVADYNARSLRAFQKAGFVVCSTIPQPTVNKVRWRHDLVLTRERHDELRATGAAGPTSI
jgi:RimJ/RimL family protein N-acetyltransferase